MSKNSQIFQHTKERSRGVHIILYTVGKSATVVNLKVNSQLEIFSLVNSQATISL